MIANVFALEGIWPQEIFRRHDFASSVLPILATDPRYLDALHERVTKGEVPSMTEFTILLFLSGMRGMHFSMGCGNAAFGLKERAELCFLSASVLLCFNLPLVNRDLLLTVQVLYPFKASTLELERIFGLVTSVYHGNHRETSLLDCIININKVNYIRRLVAEEGLTMQSFKRGKRRRYQILDELFPDQLERRESEAEPCDFFELLTGWVRKYVKFFDKFGLKSELMREYKDSAQVLQAAGHSQLLPDQFCTGEADR